MTVSSILRCVDLEAVLVKYYTCGIWCHSPWQTYKGAWLLDLERGEGISPMTCLLAVMRVDVRGFIECRLPDHEGNLSQPAASLRLTCF